MAIFRLEAKVISRGKGDRSVVAASAYRCGKNLFDERKKKEQDYTYKTDAFHTVILAPEGAPDWALDPGSLWNRVEAGERRKDMHSFFPTVGFVRLSEVLRVVPIGKTCWYEGVKAGRFPKGVKISDRCVAWRAEDIQILLHQLAEQEFSKSTIAPNAPVNTK